MARELKADLDITVEYKKGNLGSFDIYVGKENIFSLSELGRYPEDGEITELLREKFPDRFPEKAGD